MTFAGRLSLESRVIYTFDVFVRLQDRSIFDESRAPVLSYQPTTNDLIILISMILKPVNRHSVYHVRQCVRVIKSSSFEQINDHPVAFRGRVNVDVHQRLEKLIERPAVPTGHERVCRRPLVHDRNVWRKRHIIRTFKTIKKCSTL